MKKALILSLFVVLSFSSFSQEIRQRQFQDRGVTELVLFESSLPPKDYNFYNSDLLVKWHVLIFDLLEQTNGYTPNVAARTLSYINLAAYESILPKYPDYKSLSGQIQGYNLPKEYEMDSSSFSPEVAMNNAIFYMVDQLFLPAPYIWMEKTISLRDSINNIYKTKIDDFTFLKSKNYGESIAQYVYKYSFIDGGHLAFLRSYDLNYRLPECEACFEINRSADLENTGPLHPKWQNNRTFVSSNNTDFGIEPKVPFSKYPNSPFYKQVMEVYNTSKEVKPDSPKYIIANFWDDAASFTYTAPGHSASILTQHLRENPMSLVEAAKIYCTLGLALNDAVICSWKGKYKHNLIRPIAYIKRYIDSTWEPTLLTPPFPEFPSGHSVQSAAMATVLTSLLGDNIAFTDYSKFWVGEPRKFKSFWEAANETSVSRLYGGIHFMDALDQGQDMGRLVGKNILTLQFKK
ncbi:PAP2 superfamily protein [Spirosomataceae bacterium TFI 002]|nr:PAP2 superfamily protein [Spirosomataceae bacterium TFI 002]